MELYLCGPISGRPYDDAFESFQNAERALNDRGFEVTNPMKLTRNGMPREMCMKIVIPELLKCDGVVLLGGWDESNGAILEHHLALECGLMVGEFHQWKQLQPIDWGGDD